MAVCLDPWPIPAFAVEACGPADDYCLHSRCCTAAAASAEGARPTAAAGAAAACLLVAWGLQGRHLHGSETETYKGTEWREKEWLWHKVGGGLENSNTIWATNHVCWRYSCCKPGMITGSFQMPSTAHHASSTWCCTVLLLFGQSGWCWLERLTIYTKSPCKRLPGKKSSAGFSC